MHIGFITTEYPHKNLPPVGGIGAFVKTMADALVEEGHKVSVFVCLSNVDAEWFDGAIKIIQLKRRKPSKWSSITDRLYIGKIINRSIKKDKIDVIEAPDWEGLHAFCKFKVPLITRIHGSVTYFNAIEKRPTSRLLKFLEEKALKKSTAVIAVSKFAALKTKEVFNLGNRDITVIYNGVNVNKFKSIENKQLNANQILYFGTLIRKKGVLEIPFIFNELNKMNPEAELVLIGKDAIDPIEKVPTWDLMKKLFDKEAFQKVNYLGAVSYSDMQMQIANATVCIFPSYAEAFPISWLEAMAMEKGIVASSVGWAKESIVNNESGYLVFPNEHTLFANKINDLLVNQNKINAFGKSAKERVLINFNSDKLINENLQFYKNLI